MLPPSDFDNVHDMINNIVNSSRFWMFHVQKSVDEHNHNDPTILLDASQNIVGGIPKMFLNGVGRWIFLDGTSCNINLLKSISNDPLNVH
jgi:hypothetical protein